MTEGGACCRASLWLEKLAGLCAVAEQSDFVQLMWQASGCCWASALRHCLACCPAGPMTPSSAYGRVLNFVVHSAYCEVPPRWLPEA